MDDQDATFLNDFHHAPGSNSKRDDFSLLKNQKWVAENPIVFQCSVTMASLAVLLSIPPVLLRKGAPYIPTLGTRMDIMFEKLAMHRRRHHSSTTGNRRNVTRKYSPQQTAESNEKGLVFLDLGSGDGRVVFRAAREGIFRKCIGYEINPVLYMFAQTRRLVQSRSYFSMTTFVLQDLWKVDCLEDVDVVAVYGLGPIMKPLGKKLKSELRPGAIVLSNEFTFPDWAEESDDEFEGEAQLIHVYKVPHRNQE